MKNKLFVSWRMVVRDNLIKIIILLFSIIFFLGTIVSVYQKSTSEGDIRTKNVHYYWRILGVGKSSFEDDRTTSEQKEELSKIEHVEAVFMAYDVPHVKLTSDELVTENTDGKITAYVANNNTLPTIVDGTNFPDDDGYYLVCPTKLYANLTIAYDKEITNKDRIITKDLLNKKMQFTYTAYDSIGKNVKKNIDVTIVGTYDVHPNYIEDNVCYMSENLKRDTYYGKYEDGNNGTELDEESLLLILDSYENLNEVQNKLKELGYGYFAYIEVDPDFYNDLNMVSSIFCIIITIVSLCLIAISFSVLFVRKLKSYKLLNFLGYTFEDIKKINIYSNLIITSLSFILSIIFSVIYMIVMNVIIYYKPFIFNKHELVFSLKYLLIISLISFIMIVIVSLISNLSLKKRLENYEV